ncbi:MAG: hypothetical protein RTS72_05000 [Candidatus Thorarchaeota archaeon]
MRKLCIVILLSLFIANLGGNVASNDWRIDESGFVLSDEVAIIDEVVVIGAYDEYSCANGVYVNIYGNFSVVGEGNVTYRFMMNDTIVYNEIANATFGSIRWLEPQRNETRYKQVFLNQNSISVSVNIRFLVHMDGPSIEVNLIDHNWYSGTYEIQTIATPAPTFNVKNISISIDDVLSILQSR